MNTEIHIGSAIARRIDELGLMKKHVAEQMDMSQQNLQSVLKNDAIRTDQLHKFCRVLDYNFFTLYKGIPGEEYTAEDTECIKIYIDKNGRLSDSSTHDEISALKKQLGTIEQQLKEIIALSAKSQTRPKKA